MKKIKAYKVFNPDWTCNGFKYEIGKTYKLDDKPIMCNHGFHACTKVQNCFSYYSFNSENKVAKVELSGIILGIEEEKQCASQIKIIKEISWEEMLNLANTGNGNSGHSNSGDSNSGHSNSGHRNSGHWNSVSNETGYFNSKQSDFIRVFNKKCKREIWENSNKPDFIYFDLTKWIYFSDMSDQEKIDMPKAYVCDGYLKTYSYKEAWQKAYNNASRMILLY